MKKLVQSSFAKIKIVSSFPSFQDLTFCSRCSIGLEVSLLMRRVCNALIFLAFLLESQPRRFLRLRLIFLPSKFVYQSVREIRPIELFTLNFPSLFGYMHV